MCRCVAGADLTLGKGSWCRSTVTSQGFAANAVLRWRRQRRRKSRRRRGLYLKFHGNVLISGRETIREGCMYKGRRWVEGEESGAPLVEPTGSAGARSDEKNRNA